MLLLKDKPTYMYMYKIMPLSPKPTYMHMYMYAASFKLSSTPKNILADILEMPLIDLLPNNFHRLKNFFYLPVSVAEAKRTFSLQKPVKNYQRSEMMQERLNELATLSINCEIDLKLDLTTVIHDFADKSQENVSLVHIE